MVGRDDSSDKNKVFLRGLTEDCSEAILEQALSKYGNVTDVFIARDHETKLARGFAFVTFSSTKESEDAVRGMNGKDICGRPVSVEKCKTEMWRDERGGFRGRGDRGSFAGRRGGRSSYRGGFDRDSRQSGGFRPRENSRGRESYSSPRGRGGHDSYAAPRGRGRPGYYPVYETRRYSPPRGYEYRPPSRSPPPTMVRSHERPYFDERVRYARPEYVEEYMPPPRNGDSRREYRPPRRDFSPIHPREYPPQDILSRDLPPYRSYPAPRDPYSYPPAPHERYSPPPQRREYENISRSYEMPSPPPQRREEFRSPPSKSRPFHGGGHHDDRRMYLTTTHKNGGSYRPPSSPPPMRGPLPKNYERVREEVPPTRRTLSRGHSPPPKRLKSSDSRGGHRSPRGPATHRRF